MFCHNPSRENVWIKPPAQPTVHAAKQDWFAHKVKLGFWWNFEWTINHYELVQNGAVNAAALYSEQLDRVYAALASRGYPALINRKHAMLLQHDMALEY